MGTWKLEKLPEDREIIGNKWVFLQKQDETENIVQFKASLVAQGFSWKPDTDYSNDGTFAPVMQFKTLRTLSALGAINNWKIWQFDIKGAYLCGSYMKQFICSNQKALMMVQGVSADSSDHYMN